ncbi:nitroreductase family protein ['Fragaria x ananassa' phyllody phytoplasma]|uniref:Nitroreductase family protein n=1 Tax='Fragaria x ananassa' phyllody phytoplasma TaxID=2358428 RepID=A0ABS5K3P8_9MOLU|nr:nitroreductase family protein ['Fragaria x ananassa' phyllody phytoplasma]MBS2126522.1 nitroreductase family protein ['Fragaria x ananassa' phyllody phytoplasma]
MSILTTRKAVKLFQKNHQIPRHILNQILTNTMKAPSSFNLQPWHFVVIETITGKKKLQPCLYGNQSQLETSSAMILILGNTQKNETKEAILKPYFSLQKIPTNIQNKLLKRIDLVYSNQTKIELQNELYLECGIVALQLMLAAQSCGYDTCPIGGFNHKIINQNLSIDPKYIPTLIVAIGKPFSSHQTSDTFRLPFNQITTYL